MSAYWKSFLVFQVEEQSIVESDVSFDLNVMVGAAQVAGGQGGLGGG